jgi:hypothetical protein
MGRLRHCWQVVDDLDYLCINHVVVVAHVLALLESCCAVVDVDQCCAVVSVMGGGLHDPPYVLYEVSASWRARFSRSECLFGASLYDLYEVDVLVGLSVRAGRAHPLAVSKFAHMGGKLDLHEGHEGMEVCRGQGVEVPFVKGISAGGDEGR